jgi:hypothetical protein
MMKRVSNIWREMMMVRKSKRAIGYSLSVHCGRERGGGLEQEVHR